MGPADVLTKVKNPLIRIVHVARHCSHDLWPMSDIGKAIVRQ